jgi:hypothetical protein
VLAGGGGCWRDGGIILRLATGHGRGARRNVNAQDLLQGPVCSLPTRCRLRPAARDATARCKLPT